MRRRAQGAGHKAQGVSQVSEKFSRKIRISVDIKTAIPVENGGFYYTVSPKRA